MLNVLSSAHRRTKKAARHSRRRSRQFQSLEPRQVLAANVLINEFVAQNDQSLLDADGNDSDWIELFNAGDEAADLAGWSLTDDPNQLVKWSFPATSLEPGAYLVVFASGQVSDYVDANGSLHTNFKLAAAGEYLALSDVSGTVVQEFSPEYPRQFADIGYGLGAQGEIQYFPESTPGAPNSTGYSGVTSDQVKFSHPSGTFVDSFFVELTSGTPDAKIYFTTDGSVPIETSTLYDAPIEVNSTTLLRSRVIKPGEAPGPVKVERYTSLGADVVDFESQLPIMIIDNHGAGEIPNKGWSRTGSGIQQFARQPASLMMFDAPEGSNSNFGSADLSSRVGVRVRGSSSTSFSEPPYSVEFWEDGSDVDAPVSPFGMGFDSDWIVYAPNTQRDITLMDNTFMWSVSQQMGHWAPEFRYVEAFVNTDGGELTMADHVGMYILIEKVKRSESRLDFSEMAPDGKSGGWLLGLNRMDPISVTGQLPRNFHTAGPDGILETPPDLSDAISSGDDTPAQDNGYFNFDDPNGYSINESQRQSIQDWMRQMEDVLYGRADVAWNDPIEGYSKYMDVDSFVDHYLLHNFAQHNDALLLSMWYYNPDPARGGKFTAGPIWDVDLASFEGNPTSDLMFRADELWYEQLFKDPSFMQRYIDRWQELREGPFSNENMHGIIDGIFAEVGDDVAVRDDVSNWSFRLDRMKQWVVDRADAFDHQFVARPILSHPGGAVADGFAVTVGERQANLYYTVDGTDPRLPDGSISPTARLAESPRKEVVFVDTASPVRGVIRDAALDDAVGQTWTGSTADEPFDDSAWLEGTGGVGFDSSAAGEYASMIGLDLAGPGAGIYSRYEFDLDTDPSTFEFLELNMQYDDAFVAYLNGQEITRINTRSAAGEPPGIRERATTGHTALPGVFERFEVSSSLDLLRQGTNVLAIHGVNATPSSSDLVTRPTLVAGTYAATTINVDSTLVVKARDFTGSGWSGLMEGAYIVTDNAPQLRVSEVMYHPADPTADEIEAGHREEESFEFIELTNASNQPINLSGFHLKQITDSGGTEGVEFDFSSSQIKSLDPGEIVLVVRDERAFKYRYGDQLPVAGQWDGQLSNSSETITLAFGSVDVHQFAYRDAWYPATDGSGPSLEFVDVASGNLDDWNQKDSWQASPTAGGTPGAPKAPQVVGDSNHDGVFDSSDIVLALQSGHYEDTIPNNSTFEDGDWNEDGEFDSADFVFVLQFGNYV